MTTNRKMIFPEMLANLSTAILCIVIIFSAQTVAFSDPIKKIDVNTHLLNKLTSNIAQIKDPILKAKLEKYPLLRVTFQGTVLVPHGLRWKMKPGVTLKADGSPNLADLYRPVMADREYHNNYGFIANKDKGDKIVNCAAGVSWSVSSTESYTNSWEWDWGGEISVETPLEKILGGATVSANFSHKINNSKTHETKNTYELSATESYSLKPGEGGVTMYIGMKMDSDLEYEIDYVIEGKVTATFVEPWERDYSVIFYNGWDYTELATPMDVFDYPSLSPQINDRFSSLKMSGPVKVQIFEHPNYGGYSRDFFKSESRFIGRDLHSISSVKVSRTQPVGHHEVNCEFTIQQALPEVKDRTFTTAGIWHGVSGRDVHMFTYFTHSSMNFDDIDAAIKAQKAQDLTLAKQLQLELAQKNNDLSSKLSLKDVEDLIRSSSERDKGLNTAKKPVVQERK